MQRQTIGIIAAIIVIGLVAGYAAWQSEGLTGKFPGPKKSITLGTTSQEVSSLIYIAEDQGYFSDNGLNVTIKNYDAGLHAVNALSTYDVDLATASEFVLVGKILKNETIITVGSIDKFENSYLIARKDRGIATVSDLKGKKIGITRGTNAEFYLGRYLDLHGISLNDSTIVNLLPDQLNDALTKGDIDAVLTWQSYADRIKNNLMTNAVFWPAQSGQYAYWLVIGRSDWVQNHPEEIERFLLSLARAEKYLVDHPDAARTIVRDRLQYKDAYVASVWPENHFSLSLDQSLIIAMEDETRWMMNNNLMNETGMPNYLDYISLDRLRDIKPDSVNIIEVRKP